MPTTPRPPAPEREAGARARGPEERPVRVAWRERSRLVRGWRLWRTRRPVTFTEKVRYKMLRDHRDLVVTFADKAAARRYVAATVGSTHLPRLIALLEDPHDLIDLDLPPEYVVKPTHGSGAAVVVTDTAPDDARLPPAVWSWVYALVRPAAVGRDDLAEIGRAWLDKLYGRGPNHEWVYGQVPRRILVEEYLAAPGGSVPDDYKLFVFHGVCRYVEVDHGRFAGRTQDFFTSDWTHLELSGGHPWSSRPLTRPRQLDEMIALAERLGAETDFVRVDLYLLPDRIVVGELTSFPAAGTSPFEPTYFDHEFGRHWTVPRHYS